MKNELPTYEAPSVTVLGRVEKLTLGGDKKYGGSDRFTFLSVPITSTSS